MSGSNSWIAKAPCVLLLCAPLSAQVTQLASVATGGAQSHGNSTLSSIAANGRYVAFSSAGAELVSGDTNACFDVFVRDLAAGTTERASVDSSGVQGNARSGIYAPSISSEGRYVVFDSDATNLVAGDTNGKTDIFLHDRVSGTTDRASVATNGSQGNALSQSPRISADGRYIAFESDASNLVPGDTNGARDVFVRDRVTGATERVSVGAGGVQGNSYSYAASISADGRYVAFASAATNIAPGTMHGLQDVFLRDRLLGTTERISVATSGAEGNDTSFAPAVSADGRYVAFSSYASNLFVNDFNVKVDVFVRDRVSGTTELVSLGSSGQTGNDGSYAPAISADGRFVAFTSRASDLVAGDANGRQDVFVRDRLTGTTELASIDSMGAQVDADSGDNFGSISADGRFVTFDSWGNLAPDDMNLSADVYFRDRDATAFTSSCDPGSNGVIACPCSNAPSNAGRGCDNSSATGGAILSASGVAYLSMDSLVFTTSAEKPTATSIVLQGDAVAANGLVFGQGVRCVGGSLKRLYTKTASGGSITAPDSGAGDPTVSSRSASLGDVIQAGESRWYLVYYRDPIVLGSCPAARTFNATQSGSVLWSL